MKTSYFGKSKDNPNAVAICGKSPDWFKGPQYKKLAPKYWFFEKYKKDGDEEFYKEHYLKEVLSQLDPVEVYKELGENAVLLCYEKPEKFCHRHLVAQWLEQNLKIKIEEI